MELNSTQFGFGAALSKLGVGYRVRRAGWNGAGMFLFIIPGGWDFTCDVEGVDGLPTAAFICMRTAQGILVPWFASQADMLAHDWEIVHDESE